MVLQAVCTAPTTVTDRELTIRAELDGPTRVLSIHPSAVTKRKALWSGSDEGASAAPKLALDVRIVFPCVSVSIIDPKRQVVLHYLLECVAFRLDASKLCGFALHHRSLRSSGSTK